MALNRRTFYLTFIYGLWALIGTILAIPAAIYLLLPPRLRKERCRNYCRRFQRNGCFGATESMAGRLRVNGLPRGC